MMFMPAVPATVDMRTLAPNWKSPVPSKGLRPDWSSGVNVARGHEPPFGAFVQMAWGKRSTAPRLGSVASVTEPP